MSIQHARPLVIIPARFSEDASALRYEAEVAAAKLLEAVWDAGGEPLVVHPDGTAGTSSRRAATAVVDD